MRFPEQNQDTIFTSFLSALIVDEPSNVSVKHEQIGERETLSSLLSSRDVDLQQNCNTIIMTTILHLFIQLHRVNIFLFQNQTSKQVQKIIYYFCQKTNYFAINVHFLTLKWQTTVQYFILIKPSLAGPRCFHCKSK